MSSCRAARLPLRRAPSIVPRKPSGAVCSPAKTILPAERRNTSARSNDALSHAAYAPIANGSAAHAETSGSPLGSIPGTSRRSSASYRSPPSRSVPSCSRPIGEPVNDVRHLRAIPPSPSAVQHQKGGSTDCRARSSGARRVATTSFEATPTGSSRSATAISPAAGRSDHRAPRAHRSRRRSTRLRARRRPRSPTGVDQTRPPTRSRASATTTVTPASCSPRAADSPAKPAPITATVGDVFINEDQRLAEHRLHVGGWLWYSAASV
jgi:hypothetical protein